MGPHLNSKDPSWLNTLLLIATFLTLSLVVYSGYKGWKEDRALHYSGPEGHSGIIADIPVNLSGISHREHCLTCHPQGKSVQVSGRDLTFRKDHPSISPHSIDDLGCTGCHLGEGMARDLVISHGRLGNEAQKVLAGEELQGTCYRCHELKSLSGAEKAWDGFRLFSLNACDTCHEAVGREGGRYGPDLSDVGSSLDLKQIQKAIEDPRAEPENSIMPKFSLSPEQVMGISYFLKSRMRESLHETPMIKMARMKEQDRIRERAEKEIAPVGKSILEKKKCLACHKFKEEDGQIAPDLTYMAYMRQKDYIRTFLHSPTKEIPGAIMPWVRMTPAEEETIFLSLVGGGKETHLHGKSPKHLYMALCQRCHAAQGDGFGTIQPNLANFPRAFWKNAEFFRRIADERILRSVEKGIPGTSMPPYGELLGRETINSVVDLVFKEFIRIKRNEKKSGFEAPPRPANLLPKNATEKEYRKHCASCHGISGTGRGPDNLKYLPRPRDLTNQPYFESLTDDRIARSISQGVPGTAMPAFGEKISPATVWSLAERIREFSGRHAEPIHPN
jgi:mono/diheme cytochrome c family protein